MILPSVAEGQAGDPDPTFGVNGRVELEWPGENNGAFAVTNQPDGKLLVAAQLAESFAVVRLHPDGSLDQTFGSGGIAIVMPGAAFDVTVLPDGRIVAAGQSGASVALARLLSDGTLDGSFGEAGIATVEIPDGTGRGYSILMHADGRIVVAGVAFVATTRMLALRFLANGTLDTSFGNGGVFSFTQGSMDAQARTAVLRSDGRIVLGGLIRPPGNALPIEFLAVALDPDGSIYSPFANDGVFRHNASAHIDAFLTGHLHHDGGVLLAGVSGGNYAVARLRGDGTLDPAFGESGIAAPGTAGLLEEVRAIAIQDDGKILLGGNAGAGAGTHSFAALRLLQDGTLDPSYGSGGIALYSFTESFSYGRGGVLQEDQRFVVVGWTGPATLSVTRPAILRLLGDGGIDTELGPDVAPPMLVLQSYPNPAAGAATAEVTLAHAAVVRVSIVDLLGREVMAVFDGTLSAGAHVLPWRADRLPPGQYVLRSSTGDQTGSRLITVLR